MKPIAWLNVPHHKQEQGYSCAPACARMVLAYYGRYHSEDELRQLLGTDAGGTPAGHLSRLTSLGFDVDLRISNMAELSAALQAGTPTIVLLDTGSLDYWSSDCPHLAVLVGLDAATAYLNDPYFDTAPQKTSLAGFRQAWVANQCYAVFLRPRP